MSGLLIVAGGTGGHVFPALSVANRFKEKGQSVAWLGTQRGLEARVVPEAGINLHFVTVNGLRGKGVLSWLLAPFKLCRAVWQSVRVIRKVKPDCVLGMGGFVAGPGCLTAWLMRVPLVIHEQNAVAGLTNQLLAKLANKVLSGFDQPAKLSGDVQWVGNPVRPSIQANASNSGENEINVLIVGGSQGAASFNEYMPKLLSNWQQANSQTTLNVWHQSGAQKAEQVNRNYAELGQSAKVSAFIDDMSEAYAWADVLLCRSGAMTVAECCAAAKPALFVPYPFSAGNHQYFNAQAMVEAGAAMLLENHQLATDKAAQVLSSLLLKPILQKMGQAAKSCHKRDALENVSIICEEWVHA